MSEVLREIATTKPCMADLRRLTLWDGRGRSIRHHARDRALAIRAVDKTLGPCPSLKIMMVLNVYVLSLLGYLITIQCSAKGVSVITPWRPKRVRDMWHRQMSRLKSLMGPWVLESLQRPLNEGELR